MNYKEYNEKDLQSFEYETTIQSDGKIVGVCELGKATIQMINDSNNYSTYKDSWIKTVHGSFYVYDVKPVQEKVNIKLECYDIKYKLDTKYDKTKYIFPLTLKEWRNKIFDNCGVEYDNSDFPNSNLILQKHPYVEDGCSNRDVIKAIGEAGCSTIITDSNDKFYFSWFDDITLPFHAKDWLELTTEKSKSKPINLAVLGRGETEDNIYFPNEKPENPIEFRIDNNYILDPQEVGDIEDKRFNVIEPIFNRVNGFSYLNFSMRSQSIDNKLSLKLGQRVQYKDIWNNELVAYVMTRKIKWLGGILNNPDNYEITLSAKEIKESSTDLSYAASIKNDILKVERKTDKNTGAIQDLVEQTSEFDNKMTDVNQTMDKLSQTVFEEENLEREITGNNYIHLENVAKGQILNLTIAGPINFLFPDDDLYPNDDLYPIDKCYLVIDKTKKLSNEAIRVHLPLDVLEEEEKMIIENGKCRIQHADGEVEELSDVDIELFKDDNYIYLEPVQQGDINFYAKYLVQSSYTSKLVSKVEMENKIIQTNQSTDIKLSKKVGNEEIIARINMSTEKDEDGSSLEISADKLNFKGKEINLTGDDIVIKSDNFNVDKNGKIEAIAGEIGGFSLGKNEFRTQTIFPYTYTQDDITRLKEIINGATATQEEINKYNLTRTGAINKDDYLIVLRIYHGYDSTTTKDSLFELNTLNATKVLELIDGDGGTRASIGTVASYFRRATIDTLFVAKDIEASYGTMVSFRNNDDTGSLIYINGTNGNISCVTLTQTSLKENKKNFEKYSNALKELDNIDIYKYNLKDEPDKTKKHLGFVIGEGFKYSNLVTSTDGKGVDNYSFTSFCLQLIKEQQEEIKNMQQEISRIKEMIKNG